MKSKNIQASIVNKLHSMLREYEKSGEVIPFEEKVFIERMSLIIINQFLSNYGLNINGFSNPERSRILKEEKLNNENKEILDKYFTTMSMLKNLNLGSAYLIDDVIGEEASRKKYIQEYAKKMIELTQLEE